MLISRLFFKFDSVFFFHYRCCSTLLLWLSLLRNAYHSSRIYHFPFSIRNALYWTTVSNCIVSSVHPSWITIVTLSGNRVTLAKWTNHQITSYFDNSFILTSLIWSILKCPGARVPKHKNTLRMRLAMIINRFGDHPRSIISDQVS